MTTLPQYKLDLIDRAANGELFALCVLLAMNVNGYRRYKLALLGDRDAAFEESEKRAVLSRPERFERD